MSIPGLKKGGRAVFTALALLLLPVDAESQASRKVLVEEFTGMWCGDCPMGQSACNHLDSAFGPRVICISLHNMDILSSAYSDQLVNDINVTEFPVAFVDRNPFDSDGGVFQFPDDGIRSWDPAVKQRIKTDAPLSLAISSTYDVETRQMSAAIQVKAETLLNGKMRLNCVLVEDSIETDGLQRNSGNTDRDSPWFGKGNPIRHYVQRNVARINLAGNWGENGLLPQKMTTGETIEKSWFYTLPPDWNAEHMRILAFVTVWNNSGDLVDTSFFTVLNTEMNALQTGTSLPQAVKRTSSAFTSLAPNPFSASCCITFIHAKQGHAQVSILSLQGKTIATLTNEVVPEGENRVYWNGLSDTGISMPQGMYRVQLLTEDGSDSRPVILVR